MLLRSFEKTILVGNPYEHKCAIHLSTVETFRLQDQVNSAEILLGEDPIFRDIEIINLLTASKEMIDLKESLKFLHSSYCRDKKFKIQSNDFRDVLRSDYVSEAIDTAVENVSNLMKVPLKVTLLTRICILLTIINICFFNDYCI